MLFSMTILINLDHAAIPKTLDDIGAHCSRIVMNQLPLQITEFMERHFKLYRADLSSCTCRITASGEDEASGKGRLLLGATLSVYSRQEAASYSDDDGDDEDTPEDLVTLTTIGATIAREVIERADFVGMSGAKIFRFEVSVEPLSQALLA